MPPEGTRLWLAKQYARAQLSVKTCKAGLRMPGEPACVSCRVGEMTRKHQTRTRGNSRLQSTDRWIAGTRQPQQRTRQLTHAGSPGSLDEVPLVSIGQMCIAGKLEVKDATVTLRPFGRTSTGVGKQWPHRQYVASGRENLLNFPTR